MASAFLLFVAAPGGGVIAQQAAEAEVLAVADGVLAAITAEDWEGLTDLMVPEGMMYMPIERDGEFSYGVRTWTEARNSQDEVDIVERGWDPTVMIAGPVAVVWYPYDIYVAGNWSHCGVDVFTLGRTADGWKVMSMAWSTEQPPACAPHPDGPPSGTTGTPER